MKITYTPEKGDIVVDIATLTVGKITDVAKDAVRVADSRAISTELLKWNTGLRIFVVKGLHSGL